MIVNGRCAWVTAAFEKTAALEAIILAHSITRVASSAQKVIFVPLDIDDVILDHVIKAFDVVIPLSSSETSKNGITDAEYALLYSWNLTMYEKCVFISPNSLILRNCDELFTIQEISAVALNSSVPERFSASLIVLKPCTKTHRRILNIGLHNSSHDITDLLNQAFNNNGEPQWKNKLSIDYRYVISSSLSDNEKNADTAKIAVFDNKPWRSLSEMPGIKKSDEDGNNLTFANILENAWLSIFEGYLKYDLDDNSIYAFGLEESLLRTNVHQEIRMIEDFDNDAIAVVGHSCRLPGVNSSDEFWDLLLSGGDSIKKVPLERLFDFQQDDPRFTESRAGFLKCPVDEFDAKFFGISPREAAFMDPQQRLLVEVAWEALENAAINPYSLKGSNTAVFSGVWTHDYERIINETASSADFHHVVLGNAFSATSARVSYLLGLNGPNVATESGCSSSMVALHLACDSLRKRETDLALVLGANILIIHFPLNEIPILARDGRCKTFDEKADGFGRAEGVVVVVLKRFSDALKNGDRIMGLIRGSALSNEGTTSSFGTPSKYCQEIAVKEALRNARLFPEDVDYVEAHGTGTPIGDPIEFAAITAGYAGQRETPLIIGSVKTNIGHTESAAGLAGLLKVLLAMKHETIPRHINYDTLNPNINLDALPAIIPTENTDWLKRGNRVRRAGISSFGISGTNVHVIVEEPPFKHNELITNTLQDNSYHVLALSAKSENALQDLCSSYADYLEKNPSVNINDLIFTANTGRAHLKHRACVTGETVEELKQKIQNKTAISKTLTSKSKIAFLFTGHGSAYAGMAKELYSTNRPFRNAFNECRKILDNNFELSLVDVLWNEKYQGHMNYIIYSHTAIFSVAYSLTKMWKSFGVEPDFISGHSAGESAAATAAGVFTLEEGLSLVVELASLVHKYLPNGAMLAIRTTEDKVSAAILSFLEGKGQEHWLDISLINSPQQIIVSGPRETVKLFDVYCQNSGIKCQLLPGRYAFHSRAMEVIQEQYREFTTKLNYKSPNCCYVSGRTGNIVGPHEINSDYLVDNMRYSVQYPKAAKTMVDNGCNIFIEIGATPILLALCAASTTPQEEVLWLPSLRKNQNNWETVADALGKLYVNNHGIQWSSVVSSLGRNKLELPTYPFQRQKYWLDFKTDNSYSLLHPLLGAKIPLASIQDNVYEHTWNLKNLVYLQDHEIANTVILPAAGFLEIILAAGKHALLEKREIDKENISVILEDFVVESPLELYQDKQCKVQVVATPLNDVVNKVTVAVFVFQNMNGYNEEKGWKRYASASVATENTVGKQDTDIKIENIGELKKRCPKVFSTKEFYKAVADVGLCFGETFQSIQKVWKGENETIAEIPLPLNAGNIKDYIFHPIVLDAVIQTFGMSICQESSDLYLPVGVEKFTLLNLVDSEVYFAHAQWEFGKSSGIVKLYNERNVLLAEMNGLRLVKTSISSFLNVINSQKNMLPGMYQESWRSRDGHLHSRVDLHSTPDILIVSEDLGKEAQPLPYKYLTNLEIKGLTDKMVYLRIIECFLKRGLDIKPGSLFNISFLTNSVGSDINPKIMNRFLEILQEVGYLELQNHAESQFKEWRLVKPFPMLEEVLMAKSSINSQIDEIEMRNPDIVSRTVLSCLKNLDSIFQKSALVSNRSKDDSIDNIFTNGLEFTLANMKIAKYLQKVFNQLKSGEQQSGSILRILEIGAGKGGTTKTVLNALQQTGIPFRYMFTDKDSSALTEAKIKFSETSGIEYKLLNIDIDPTSQGFVPFYYDVLIAANVMHTAKDIVVSVKNVRSLISDNGYFLLQEPAGPQRWYDMIFGLSDEFWECSDFDFRGGHPCINFGLWGRILEDCKFGNMVSLSEHSESVQVVASRAIGTFKVENEIRAEGKRRGWILLGDDPIALTNVGDKLRNIGRKVHIIQHNTSLGISEQGGTFCEYHSVNICDQDDMNRCFKSIFENCSIDGICYLSISNRTINQQNISLPLLLICQYVMAHSCFDTGVYSVVRGAYFIGDQKFVNPSTAPLIGMLKTLCLEFPESLCKVIDLDPESRDIEGDSVEIFSELISGSDLITLFRNKKKFVNRLTLLPKPIAPVTLPQGRYTIVTPSSKQLNDVSFRPVEKSSLGHNDIEVEVKAVALNFRDVFVIIKPEQYHTLFEAVGTDFSGVISDIGISVKKYKIGDKVFGTSNTSSAASHVVINENMVLPKPGNFTYADGATLPSVFLTAYYCLYNVADLKKGETILIHVASGGVGLVAIQLANLIGANIIATAGSKRKRNYLRSIGVENVFHSRDLSFGDEISRVTNGKGVDVVLNSLTGAGFKETSLKACSPRARFVEMGKVNIWKPEEVHELRPDVHYTIVDVEKTNEADMMKLLESMKIVLQEGHVTPLPYSRFEIAQIKEALNYFLKALHIGKVVLSMPEIKESNGRKFTKEVIFNDNSTYLVTGGLGGIGLEVAKWMCDSGAKFIVMVGRSPPDEKAKQVISGLRSSGCHVVAKQVDVGNWDECKKLFDLMESSESKLPVLRGVVHSAGCLSDGVLINQTWEKFSLVFNAKVNGGWNLHNLTKNMPLEHFVLFSSVAGLLGNPGQSNHSAANLFLDSLAAHRYSLGLPAQTIQWGAWSSIGAATNTTFGREGAFGFKPFTPTQGISALKFIMTRPNLTQVAVVQMNVKAIKEHFRDKGNGLSELDDETEDNSLNDKTSAASETFWVEINLLSEDERVLYIRKHLEKIIRRTLKLPETEQLDEHQPFSDMGLDSLMAVEMKNKLQNIVGKNMVVSTNSLLDFPTINGLCKFLAKETMNVCVTVENVSNKNQDSESDLVKQDSILPTDIQSLGHSLKKPCEIRNVLVTGATGCFGAYILNELLENPHLNICCLIKGTSIPLARKRLISNLLKYNLRNSVSNLNRISIVIGNIAEYQLGVSEDDYLKLSSEIDMIFHFAAKAHHIEQYRETKSKSDIRSVNVFGTVNILRLAANIKTKKVVYSSSYTAANRLTEDGFVREEFPENDNYGEELKMGYVLSKFVCEKLLKEANERCIPCTVIRYPTLGGHSETGLFIPGNSTFVNLLLLSMHLGVVPKDEKAWYSICVDIAAKLTMKLAFSEITPPGLYHLNLSEPIYTTDFIQGAAKFGHHIRRVADEDYKKIFLQESEKNALLSYFAESYGTDLISVISDVNPVLTQGFQSQKNIYKISEKLYTAIPDLHESIRDNNSVLSKYLEFANSSGILNKPS